MKKSVLIFCGFKPVTLTAIGNVKGLSQKKIEKHIKNMYVLGTMGD